LEVLLNFQAMRTKCLSVVKIKRLFFNFLHGSGSSTEYGFTLENNAGSENRWTFYVKHGYGTLTLTRNDIVVGTFASNGLYSSSDRKLKKNINPLKDVMKGILALNPSKYDYITSENTGKKSIVFIAQEVNKYFPELVLDEPIDDGEVLMQVNYAGFGVLAIKAIQEQQDQIVSQKLIMNVQDKRIEKQEQIIGSMQSQMNDFLVRISSFEEQEKR